MGVFTRSNPSFLTRSRPVFFIISFPSIVWAAEEGQARIVVPGVKVEYDRSGCIKKIQSIFLIP